MPNGFLSEPVQYIKGVGPKRAELLKKIGISTIADALFYLPFRYEDRSSLKKINQLQPDEMTTVRGEVARCELVRRRKGFSILEVTVSDNSGHITAKFFNQPFLKKIFKIGKSLYISGTVKTNRYLGVGFEMENPEYEAIEDESDRLVHTLRIVPVYRSTSGLGQKTLRGLLHSIVESCAGKLKEYMPDDIIVKHSFPGLEDAVRNVHFPEDDNIDLNKYNSGTSRFHKRLSFDELFLYQIGVIKIKSDIVEKKGISFVSPPSLTSELRALLDFDLTGSQERVVAEIFSDMESENQMNRLIQGDVGSGKTVVAVMAMLKAVENGYKAVMMVPTELLAQQHYQNITKLLKGIQIKCALLTSGEKINEDAPDIIIGTHSLIQKGFSLDKLGLAIVDEQHRFGVRQRAQLRKKGTDPDVLVMTATPIPRTLAMTLYGDLDHSVIDELPPGRKPIDTMVFMESEKNKVYDILRREIGKGGQAYIVYPVIEEDEELNLRSAELGYEAFKELFRDRAVDLVHGRIRPEDRNEIMNRFKSGDIDILVGTTVIEVGVDVPNANVMVIVHAERFGLSQLHQLRGRVGRGERGSFCVLLVYGEPGEEAVRRIRAMERTSDGFKIAEEDLNIRGPGDFFGTEQSGYPQLRIANLIRDRELLELSRSEAVAILEKDPMLDRYPDLRHRANKMWENRTELYKTV